MYGRQINAYKNANVAAEVAVADPYIITKMMYQGVFERLAQAKGAISRGDLQTKASRLSSASRVLEYLKSTLDFSFNKTIAQNLFDIYSFMIDKIADAAVQLSCEPIDAALRAFMPIKEAWDKIPMSAREEAQAQRTPEQLKNQLNQGASLARGHI
ncbi:MAG TPA: flagellar export chaperone FliS [Succinivibrionaceae bacterium]|nr:flagellar export chaperone FliS [Succinivibrio sp.]HAR80730.1 flagellar export chaperone FliS [Succinivibrionaceae bacterium]